MPCFWCPGNQLIPYPALIEILNTSPPLPPPLLAATLQGAWPPGLSQPSSWQVYVPPCFIQPRHKPNRLYRPLWTLADRTNRSLSPQRSHADVHGVVLQTSHAHCSENRIYVFLEKELRRLSPNSYILVPVCGFYISRIGPHTVFGCSKLILKIYKSLTDIWVWELGDRKLQFCFGNKEAAQFHFWEYINGNQTFILDFHGPFICTCLQSMRLNAQPSLSLSSRDSG
jgi:hypothetical protein